MYFATSHHEVMKNLMFQPYEQGFTHINDDAPIYTARKCKRLALRYASSNRCFARLFAESEHHTKRLVSTGTEGDDGVLISYEF